MALTYGQQRLVRITVDIPGKKIVASLEKDIEEDGTVISTVPSTIVARREKFVAVLNRLFPQTELNRIKSEVEMIINEQAGD